ncbi:MAG: M28 family peptidase [Acidobacteria bacterium]|nr:M28 family peptidase [Acidobacteriota bacterium]
MKRILVFLLLLSATVTIASSESPVADRCAEALEAWNNGDFIPALEGFEAVIGSPEADRYFETIALLTGELFQVSELTADGRSPRFSPSGRHVAYETGPRTAAVTCILTAGTSPQKVIEVNGTRLVFSPVQDAAAYLRVPETPEIAKVRAELEELSAQAAPERQAVAAKQRELAWLEARHGEIVLLDLVSRSESILDDGGLLKGELAFSSDGKLVYFTGAKEDEAETSDIYAASTLEPPRAVTSGLGFKAGPLAVPGGSFLIYTVAPLTPFPRGAAAQQGSRPGMPQSPRRFAVLHLADGKTDTLDGTGPAVSADGKALAYVGQSAKEAAIHYAGLESPLKPKAIKKTAERIGSANLAADGSRVVFDITHQRNQEVFCIGTDGKNEVRLSRNIEHDRNARFLTASQVLAVRGESRHSRAYLYDLDKHTGIRLFHNNTVRTIAPEYEWAANPAGNALLIVAERDGDTISPERGVYYLDLTRKIPREDLLARIRASLASEKSLRARGESMFQPIADQVRSVVARVSMPRLYEYQEELFRFDSKHITQPGNKPAGDYIYRTFQSFGYEPEYQRFTARDLEIANILATLRGTENPEIVYVLSSHFDSNQRGPGADDNSSATAVLLETARLLARHPMPSTIIFAAFTGEEAGLLGSREFVRQAVEKKLNLAAALNNDMIGWSNDYRLDNTIRYSNAGIRDLQHAAAFLFSKMITYDARYVKSTDAAAYYDAYGDIVGGLGSYPVLGSPYYHQPTDLLENINQELLVEAARANTAAIMLLASSPSKVKGLRIDRDDGAAVLLSWNQNPEKAVSGYRVRYGTERSPAAHEATVKESTFRLSGLPRPAGEKLIVAVRAVTDRGLEGWDWTTVEVPPQGRR